MLTAGSPLSARDRLSAQLTLAYQHHALGEHAAALTIYDSFDWASPPTSGVVDGDAAVVERIRARTLQGISLEVAHQADARALACYLDAVALLSRLSAAVSPTPAYLLAAGATRPQIPSLIAFREVYRHVSTALTRAAVITARTPDTPQLLRILRTYHALATAWSGSPFRAHQRQRMLSLYLAALQASYPAAGAACPEPYLLGGGVSTKSARATWRAEVSEAVRSGQRMLADTTTFPKSGDVNEAVTEFASQAAAFPALAPSLAPEIINVLWWGTTLTFQSQSILRHLVNLLSAAAGEDKTEARRTFELYVQLVLKARQAADPDATLALRGCEDDARVNDADEALVSERERERAELEMGMDDDEEFTATLLVGAGMLLASFDDSEEAWRYVTLASDVTRHGAVSPKLAAKVDELRGIVRLVMSTSGELIRNTDRPLFC
jgi:hypothetical protein